VITTFVRLLFLNRVAQRAFRERKQSQLAELQTRIQLYEQGEIERNVALQKVAQHLKDENGLLRQENVALQARIAELEEKIGNNAQEISKQTKMSLMTQKKRDRNGSSSEEPLSRSEKRSRNDISGDFTESPSFDACYGTLPSTNSVTSTAELINRPDQFSPIPYATQQEFDSSTYHSLSPGIKSMPSFPFACGLCSPNTICVCSEIVSQSALEHTVSSVEFHSKDQGTDFAHSASSCAESVPVSSTKSPSILDNLPSYEPPIPIRRRVKGVSINSVFPIREAKEIRNVVQQPTCSGDPSNCLACADDTFGQAFCAAVSNSSASCDCSAETISRCCGISTSRLDRPSVVTPSNVDVSYDQVDLMHTNDAWQKLKAHPNARFADLKLLAEVVVNRSKCNGPQLEISPTSQFHQDRVEPITNCPINGKDSSSSRHPDRSPPKLVPEEVLLRCGRRRMRQVHADGVQEALRILDAKFS
jgi:hypothetical protein